METSDVLTPTVITHDLGEEPVGKVVKNKVIFHNPNIFSKKRFSIHESKQRQVLNDMERASNLAPSGKGKVHVVDLREELVSYMTKNKTKNSQLTLKTK